MIRIRLIAGAFILAGMACRLALAVPYFCAVGSQGEFVHIDPTTKAVTVRNTDLPHRLKSLALSPDGTLYASTSFGAVYQLDPLTGATQLVASFRMTMEGLAFSPSGQLYATCVGFLGAPNLNVLDLTNGTYQTVGTLFDGMPRGLAFSPQGQLYGISLGSFRTSYRLMTINPDTATSTVIGEYAQKWLDGEAIAFTPEGSLYVLGTGAIAQVDPANATVIGSVVELPAALNPDLPSYTGLAYIPEPSCLMLCSVGLVASFWWRRRCSESAKSNNS